MIVYVPVPMSAVALLTVSRPSAVSTAFADAPICIASQTPPAMPHPTSALPSRIQRGRGFRRAPAEPLRGLSVTGAKLLARKWLVLAQVSFRVVFQTQLDGIRAEPDGQLVHRAFDREQ